MQTSSISTPRELRADGSGEGMGAPIPEWGPLVSQPGRTCLFVFAVLNLAHHFLLDVHCP